MRFPAEIFPLTFMPLPFAMDRFPHFAGNSSVGVKFFFTVSQHCGEGSSGRACRESKISDL